MVIIKGVKTFQNNISTEYSDLDITQMLGRAVSLYVTLYRHKSDQNRT